jgi:peptide/nickel transport system substrate-binding protein
MRTLRRTAPTLALTALATVTSLVLAGCGPKDSGTNASEDFNPDSCQGGTLYVLNSSDTGHFDPARIYTSGGGAIPSLLFRTLTTRNRVPGEDGLKVVPDLATDIGTPSDGARTWTYHLKNGLKFENGEPITSADVKYGIERSFAPELSGGAPYLHDWLVGGKDYAGPYADKGGLDSIQTPDDQTIVFKLTEPHGDFPYLATATQFAPVPEAADDGVKYENHPVSSGPYKIESYDRGNKLDLVRNDAWSRDVDDERLACPDKIDISMNLDPAVINERLANSSGNDANAISTDTPVGPAQLAQLPNDDELSSRAAHAEFGSTTYVAFNTQVKPYDDINVRAAFSELVDRTTVIDAAGGSSLAYPATTVLPEQDAFGFTKYDAFPAGESGDPEAAKQTLAKANVPAGTQFELTFSTDSDTDPKAAAALQDAAKAAGIDLKLNGLSGDAYSEAALTPSKEPGMVLFTWGADWPSGGPFLQPLFDGRQILPVGNFNLSQVDDPKINAMFDEASKETDPAAAASIYGQIDKLVGEQAYVLPLYHEKSIALYGSNVQNAYVDEWRGWYDIAMVSVA